jgi:hypothetical protein
MRPNFAEVLGTLRGIHGGILFRAEEQSLDHPEVYDEPDGEEELLIKTDTSVL